MPATRLVRATALALVAFTALSLTGCQPGGKKRHRSSSSGYKSSDRNDSFGSGSSSNGKSRSKHRSSHNGDRICLPDDLRLAVEPVSQPANRILIKAVNNSDRPCEINGYPQIRFGGVQSAPKVVKESRPVAEPRLQPREAAYAAVQTSGTSDSEQSGTRENFVSVGILTPSLTETIGPPVRLRLAKQTSIGETAVGYWWSTTAGALNW